MRDFLGLGNLCDNGDHAETQIPCGEPFRSASGFSSPSITMDFTGEKYSMLNVGYAISARNNIDEKYMEGSAETFGLSGTKQWTGMVSNARIEAKAKPNAMPLTIFYGGHVNVYNNMPVDRAEEIMNLASKGDMLPTPPFGVSHTMMAPGFLCQPTPGAENLGFNAQMGVRILFAADEVSQNGPPIGNKLFDCAMPNTPSTASSPQHMVPRALPLARKASLARFLEKRKERMQMMSPYFKKQFAATQEGEHPQQNRALSELYGQYFTRPTMVYRMREHTADMSSTGIPAKD